MKRRTVSQLHGFGDREIMTVAEKATVRVPMSRPNIAVAEETLEMPISKIVRQAEYCGRRAVRSLPPERECPCRTRIFDRATDLMFLRMGFGDSGAMVLSTFAIALGISLVSTRLLRRWRWASAVFLGKR